MTRGPLLLCGLLLLGGAVHSWAQPEEANWYQVELLVFQYLREPDGERAMAEEPERYPMLPELHYPPTVRWLRSGSSSLQLEQDWRLRRVEELLSPRGFGLAYQLPVDVVPGSTGLRESSRFLSGTALRASVPAADPGQAQTGPVPDFSVPAALVRLPPTEHRHRAQWRAIHRQKGTRVLFQEAWRQPVPSREKAVPLVIQSTGDTDYPVLQGSILLYVARYLHLETNLWLNLSRTDLPSGWSMPPPPAPPPQWQSVEDFEFRVDLAPDFATAESTRNQTLADDLAALDSGSAAKPFDVGHWLTQPSYLPFNHALSMQQRRRLRGGEQHYLDHPHLGILVVLEPYEFTPMLPPADE